MRLGSRGQVRSVEWLLALVLLGGLAAYAFRWGIEGLVHNRKVQTLPDLKGKPLSAALDLLAPLNLALKKDGEEFNNGVPIGAILRQTPPVGTKVREGKVVRVVLSQGGETVFAPAIVGLPLRNAEMQLRQNQLMLGEVAEAYSLRTEKGMVLSQEPKAESSVERNSLVKVVVSGGQPPSGVVLMPDFVRKDVAEATSWAEENGVQVAVAKDPASLFPYGAVLAQDPQPDAVVPARHKVKVTISSRVKAVPGGGAMKTVHYEVSQGSADSLVRIVVVDQYGERELFNGMRPPGSKIDLPIPDSGHARMKVFLNGILVEERDL